MDGGEGTRAGAAVVIGVGAYRHADRVRPLRFAAHDAEAVADALIDPGVCGLPAAKVKLLTDGDATRDAVAHHLSKWLPEQATQAEIVVIYFAGHGTVHEVGRREEGYLLAHDADPDDLATRGVLMADLSRWIDAIDAEAVVVCLDCCHAAKVIPRGGTAKDLPTRDMRLRPALLQPLAGRGRYLIASCDDGQVSVEADDWGHGLFTHHLLAGLRGAGDRDADGRVGIAEFFEYVSEAVERDARAIGLVQKPWISATGPGGVFLSIRAGKREGPPAPVGRTADRLDAERLWREQGSTAAIRALEGAMEADPAGASVAALELLGRMNDPAAVPLLFRCLADSSEAVRGGAKAIIRSFGWERVTDAIKDFARRGDDRRIGPILEGLAALEAHEETVGLLDHLTTLLKGNLRNRAILLLERKQQGLNAERVASLFRDSGSRYQILKPLGQGLFTAAYLARDESNDLDVVVRVLRPEYAGWPQIRAQFMDLARRSVKLVHHNLVLTRDVRDFADRQVYYAVRDYVDGVTLQRLVETGRAFRPRQIIQILRQVLLGLTPIHARGLVHGSIKPSNVFLCGDDLVVLGDLAIPAAGISLQVERLSYDYRYASPELFLQGGVLGPWSDLYSVGCLAYELCCGVPPFISDNHYELAAKHCHELPEPPSQRGSRLGPAGDPLILRLLTKPHTGRCADVQTALHALDELDAALPKAERPAAEVPIVGDASLVRYANDDRVSVVSLWANMGGSGDPDDDTASFQGVFITPAAGDVRDPGPACYSTTVGLTDRDDTPDRAGEAGAPIEPRPDGRFGRYLLIRTLGRGGMGSVFLAQDPQLNRRVAIKLNRAQDLGGPEGPARFLREARAVARLDHPNIVKIYDIGQMNIYFYTVFEYVGGGNLRERLRAAGPVPAGEASELLVVLARAMDYAHSLGIVHRDLKPSNVLLAEDGTPKIGDFGLARMEVESSRPDAIYETSPGMIVGTPAYMAPEQARGETHRLGPAVDIYSLGAMYYELLTGEVPFRGRSAMETLAYHLERAPRSPREVRPEIPVPVEAICLTCLAKEPRRRYATAGALADDLERFLGDRPLKGSEGVEVDAAPRETERSLEARAPKRSPNFWDKARKFFPFKRPGREGERPAS